MVDVVVVGGRGVFCTRRFLGILLIMNSCDTNVLFLDFANTPAHPEEIVVESPVTPVLLVL